MSLAARASRGTRRWGCAWLAAVLAFGFASPGEAQVTPGGNIPTQIYFNALPGYYDGNYRGAMGVFLAEARGGIKTGASLAGWIDAIPYYTMAGECYYQLGQYDQALAQYNSALKLFVAYSDWMMRVQFDNVAPSVNAARATPWGQSKRGATVGVFRQTYLMGQGRIDQSDVVRNGGVLAPAILVPVHVSEIVRATCLSIRRRRDLLGPLCKLDPLTASVLEVLGRKPGPPNHWSEAWVSVELGCAYAAAGSLPQAKAALERGVLVGGQFDHPLTSTALVELARLALDAGEFPQAMDLAQEASYACFNFPDWTNLEEAFRIGSQAHLMLNQKTPYRPLGPAMNWARAQAPRSLYVSLALSAAENMVSLGETTEATAALTAARTAAARSDLPASQLGARLSYLTSVAAYQAGNVRGGDQAIDEALAFQRRGSLWAYHIRLADARYLSGQGTDRSTLQLFETLLREPTANDWAAQPLECLSVLTAPLEEPLVHWFELVHKSNKEHDLALEIADRVRRHRFYGTLPLGGRLLALRWILEGPVELLSETELLERQNLLVRYPKYARLTEQATAMRGKLTAGPPVPDRPDDQRMQVALVADLESASAAQEVILREMAVRREAAAMVFPPLRKTADVQQSLTDGQVLLAFLAADKHLYAFLFSRDRYASWQVQSPVQLQKQVSLLLRDMGNYDANHELTLTELTKSNWRATGDKVLKLLLERSNVDLAGNFNEIVIVPDGFLWYLPFEALPVGSREKKQPLIVQSRVRYAPTVGLAVPSVRLKKPQPKIGVALGRMHPQDDDTQAIEAYDVIGPAVSGSVALPRGSASAAAARILFDGLIVFDDIDTSAGPYAWAPLKGDKSKPGAPVESWQTLPWGVPEHLILPGFHTAAEGGLRRGNADGRELFLSLCGLMASGARTVLISRWRTAGQTSFDLVREFAQELPHVSPAEAWQRSVQVASDTPIDPERERRVKKASTLTAEYRAEHPFFWAGYMLVDSGVAEAGADGGLKLPGKRNAVPAQPANPQPANPRAGVPIGAPGVAAPPVPDSELDPAAVAAEPTGAKNRPKAAKKAPPAKKSVPKTKRAGADPATG